MNVSLTNQFADETFADQMTRSQQRR